MWFRIAMKAVARSGHRYRDVEQFALSVNRREGRAFD
jgi:hypothetical protein